jgi:CheY-like chemotaxis protein
MPAGNRLEIRGSDPASCHAASLPTGWDVSGKATRKAVLVVDDNHDVADTLTRVIQSYGYETMAVYSGEEAISATGSFHPGLVMLDIGMPGLNGYETVKRIRAQRDTDHIIIVAVTALGREEDKRQAYE